MRCDAEVADARIVGQDRVERGELLSGAGTLVEDVGDRTRSGRAAREGLGDRAVELGGAGLAQELGEPDGVTADVLATEREGIEQLVGVLAHAAQQVAPAEVVGAALVARECGDVSGILDGLAAVVAARMPCDDILVIDVN